jgi:central kinetochore subunit Mis15/CHL4
MASRRVLVLPTAAALPGTLRVPATDPSLAKLLLRLARTALLVVIQEWLKTRNQATCGPVLGEDDAGPDAPYDTAQTLEELREVYSELGARKGGKREVVDRVLEGDWRHGLSLRQLAMVDVQILLDHPTSRRWTARRLEKIIAADDDRGYKTAEITAGDEVPRLRGSSFVQMLQQAIGSMVKAHYYLTRLEALSISLLRIQILDSPYNTQASLEAQSIMKTSETLLVAFPDYCSYIYLSASTRPAQGANAALGLRKIVTDTVSRALSQPQKRYALKTTNLIARSLSSLVFLQGPSGSSTALGGWSIFAEGSVESSPLVPATSYKQRDTEEVEHSNTRKRSNSEAEQDPTVARLRKRKCLIAQKRFGKTGIVGDGRGIERFDVRLENRYSPVMGRQALGPKDSNVASTGPLLSKSPRSGAERWEAGRSAATQDDWKPSVTLTFHGSHVFAGFRGLIEAGAIDGARMPGWMTGEHGVSAGVVRDGLMKRRKGFEY